MSEFVNRTGTNLNRKVFDVESVQRDGTGEIIQIIGNLFRNDREGLTQEGTPLEARELNSVVKDIAYNTTHKYLDVEFEYENGLLRQKLDEVIMAYLQKWLNYEIEIVNINSVNELNKNILLTKLSNTTYEITGDYDNVEVSLSTVNNNLNVSVTFNDSLTEGTYEFTYFINFYNVNTNRLVKKVLLNINYTSSSTTPED